MALKYELKPMKVGFGKDKKDAFVARTQLGETVSTEQLVEQVALRTQQQPAAVHTVLDNLVDSIYHFASMGNGVRVGELGIIKPALESRAAEAAGDVAIAKLKYNYMPSVKMKAALEKLTVRKTGDTSPSSGGGTPGGGEGELT